MISSMDMDEWLVGLNDPKNASTKPPRGAAPGKDVVFNNDHPDSSPFCIIDIKPRVSNPFETFKGNLEKHDSQTDFK